MTRRLVPRRRFLAWCALLPGAAAVAASPSDAEVQKLRERAATLTGFDAAALDAGFAAALWAAFASRGRLAELRAWLGSNVPRAGAPDSSPVAVEVAAAWYGGMIPAAQGDRVGDFYGALAWQAADFAQPRGRCGVPGRWAQPPGSR